MQGKFVYIRPKVVRPFPRPCGSGSYVQRAAIYFMNQPHNVVYDQILGPSRFWHGFRYATLINNVYKKALFQIEIIKKSS
jgi:hypothetical protein